MGIGFVFLTVYRILFKPFLYRSEARSFIVPLGEQKLYINVIFVFFCFIKSKRYRPGIKFRSHSIERLQLIDRLVLMCFIL